MPARYVTFFLVPSMDGFLGCTGHTIPHSREDNMALLEKLKAEAKARNAAKAAHEHAQAETSNVTA